MQRSAVTEIWSDTCFPSLQWPQSTTRHERGRWAPGSILSGPFHFGTFLPETCSITGQALDNWAFAVGIVVHPERGVTSRQTTSAAMDFRFLPTELTSRCSELIEVHHGAKGYWNLPDLLWHEETREFIAKQANLQLVFRKASTTRSQKKALKCYVLIMTVMLSLEVLASDFAGWGRRFPVAKRKATAAVNKYLPSTRTRLLDYYLPLHGYQRSDLVKLLTPLSPLSSGSARG